MRVYPVFQALAERVLPVALLASILQIAIMLASLVVWGRIINHTAAGETLIERTVPATRPRPFLANFLALSWVVFSFVSMLAEGHGASTTVDRFDAQQALYLLTFNLLLQVFTTCVLLVSLTQLGNQRLTRFGLDDRHAAAEVRLGLIGYLAAVAPVIVANVSMQAFRTDDNEHIFLQILQSQQSLPLVMLMTASAVIMAPLSEELLYRVILQGTLQRHLPPVFSILISSVIFSAVHGFPDAMGLFPLAVILGFLYWKTGSYLSIVTTHAVFNGVTILLTLLSPENG